MRPVVVTGRRRPHEVAVLACSTLLGALFLAGAPMPPSLQVFLPRWVRVLWLGLLLTGGVIGLAGLWVPRVDVGLALERAGMIGFSSAAGIFAVMAFFASGWRGLGGGGFLGALAAASVWRALQITHDLRAIRGAAIQISSEQEAR